MATYSATDFDTSHYNIARPSYPESFYKFLIQYHDKSINEYKRESALDIGCGSGFVTFKLLEYFDKVIGTDISDTMIGQCKQDERTKIYKERIQFFTAKAEQAPSQILPSSIDLLTGAECCHWVDHDEFFKESFRVLKPGGTLAYWFYGDPIFVGYPEANDIYNKYTFGSSLRNGESNGFERYLGPYYEQPGRQYLRELLSHVHPPEQLFEDIVREEYHPETSKSKTPLYISKRSSLRHFMAYVKSWSAYHAWMKENGDKYDVAEAFVEELSHRMGWDLDFELELTWTTVYTVARKKSG
ncbi:Piso0_001280 [Millerozyma farinosa CBS 7064]|uniref:Piso0_001280 protein n=1 Tax=Pichia sorbitophila (strain ATCC MYA-4447 / BCRC 22081 / CBS 7064 / NBRC 10061 / NRRL Y-12695) TaxID=559304 RepID=G8YDY1_PICSO|nr:Piso0_001280 [Millerozyma farinosa CBS 7064]